jgi:hypothetical protein
MRVKLRSSFFIKDSYGRLKERRCMIADAHGMPMSGASAHLIANSWTTANAFRRCSLALNLTRMSVGVQFGEVSKTLGSPRTGNPGL